MSLQGERLRRRLSAERVPLLVIATNPEPPAGLRLVRRIPLLRTILREGQYLFSLRRLISRRVAVVHHLSASGLFFFLHSAPVLVLGRLAGKRVILNYRGGRAAEFLSSWGWAVKPLLRLSSQIAVPSEFLRRIFAGHGVNSVLLPNLAEADLFTYRERKPFSPRLLVTRNLEPMYNVECILRAFAAVQREFPQAVLGIVGSGTEENRLRRMVNDWRLPGVTFYGAMPNEQLPHIYDQHDIYINASSVDNFPGALVEAACSGLVIVTTRAGGIPDMLPHRQRAILVPVNDSQALAEGVLECLRNQQLACQLVHAARLWAEQFSWTRVFPRLMECYGISPPLGRDLPVTKTVSVAATEVRKGIPVS